MAVIGIDLGTTNSLAGVWQDGKVVLIPNAFGEYLTPSVVSIGKNQSRAAEAVEHHYPAAKVSFRFKDAVMHGRKKRGGFLGKGRTAFVLRVGGLHLVRMHQKKGDCRKGK